MGGDRPKVNFMAKIGPVMEVDTSNKIKYHNVLHVHQFNSVLTKKKSFIIESIITKLLELPAD